MVAAEFYHSVWLLTVAKCYQCSFIKTQQTYRMQ